MYRIQRCGVRASAAWGAWREREHGVSEAAATIFILPLMIALIFVLIELGFNLQYRAKVDNIVQDTVRSISNEGGVYWPKTYTGPAKYGTGAMAGTGWEGYARDRLTALCGTVNSVSSRCSSAPTITCTPQIAAYAGVEAKCTVTFPYKPVASFMSNNPAMNLGFGGIWSKPFTTTVTAPTTVGQGDPP